MPVLFVQISLCDYFSYDTCFLQQVQEGSVVYPWGKLSGGLFGRIPGRHVKFSRGGQKDGSADNVLNCNYIVETC